MTTKTMLLITVGLALAGCELGRPVSPEEPPDALTGGSPLQPGGDPDFLIGQSPLAPLSAPLDVEIWYWTNPRTGETNHLVEVGVRVAEEQIENAAKSGARLETTAVFSQNGKTIIKPAGRVDALTDLTARATGDGYAIVVIALPLTTDESDALSKALARGETEFTVQTELVSKNDAGGWDILDDLGSLLLADPRPSPLPLPPEFFN